MSYSINVPNVHDIYHEIRNKTEIKLFSYVVEIHFRIDSVEKFFFVKLDYFHCNAAITRNE